MRIVLTQPARRGPDLAANLDAVARLVDRRAGPLRAGDLLLLPELIGDDADPVSYEAQIQEMAARLGVWIVGGSHIAQDGDERTNCGIVADPRGATVARYGKLNPYGDERARGTQPGAGPASFRIGELSCLVMICADFWHAPAFKESGTAPPDLILVPAFSASQRPQPDMARARWRHAMVARAYEFAAFVAVSDWAHPTPFAAGVSSGVAGLAHPNPASARHLHTGLGRRRAAAFELDLGAVRDLRGNREARGFDLTRHLRLEVGSRRPMKSGR